VAFVIAAVALTLLIRAFSGGLRLSATAEDYGKASVLARSLMTQIGMEYSAQNTPISGTFAERFDWVVNIEPYSIDAELPAGESVVRVFKCMITVAWFEGTKKRQYELSSLRLMTKQSEPIDG